MIEKRLTSAGKYAIVSELTEFGRFFYVRIFGFVLYITEVEVVRTKITLACTECKRRNYNLTKDKKTHPDRMETKKYCRFCKTHTMHKETK